MNIKAVILTATMVSLTGLSACYESADVTVHEPGVYKGRKDPLLEKQRDAAQQESLRQRFNMVQTDR